MRRKPSGFRAIPIKRRSTSRWSGSRLIRHAALVALVALVSGVGEADGQTRTVQDCRGCDVQPEPVVRLGTMDGEGVLGAPNSVARRANGEWVVTDYQARGTLQVFTAAGQFSRRIGRLGEGPGEYQIPERLWVLPGDSLEVVDYAGGRVTKLDPSLEFSSSRPIRGGGQSIAQLGDGTLIVSARVSTSMSVGLPIHMVGDDGFIRRSFGSEEAIRQFRNPTLMRRSLASAGDAAVWSAELNRYRIQRWQVDGRLEETLERSVDWMRPQEEYGLRGPNVEPAPGLVFIHTDSEGLIWTIVRVPDPEWKKAFAPGRDPYGRPTSMATDLNKAFDTIVEVIDPGDARVVRRARFDHRLSGFAGDGLVFAVELVDDLYPVIRVWRIPPRG